MPRVKVGDVIETLEEYHEWPTGTLAVCAVVRYGEKAFDANPIARSGEMKDFYFNNRLNNVCKFKVVARGER